MLPKSYRLSRRDIVSLRRLGKRFQKSLFAVIYKPNMFGHLRLSTEISLKVDKRSSYRNKIRRKIFHLVEKSTLISKSFDVLVIVKPAITRSPSNSTAFSQSFMEVTDTLLGK